MDTLLILRDTITTNVVKVVDSCQPCIQEAETNCQDVAIVGIICFTIIVIMMYGTRQFFKNKAKEREYQKGRESQHRNWDVEDKNRKDTEERKKRNWQVVDQKYKRKDDLLYKYLEFMKEQTQEGEEKSNSNVYRQILEHLIELSQQNKINTFTKKELYQNIENDSNEETEKPSSKS